MRLIEVEGVSRRSTIHIGERLQNLPRLLPRGPAVIITDSEVLRRYRDELPPLPVLSIALESGFQSIGPFNRAFKAATGLTPTEFRREQLAES